MLVHQVGVVVVRWEEETKMVNRQKMTTRQTQILRTHRYRTTNAPLLGSCSLRLPKQVPISRLWSTTNWGNKQGRQKGWLGGKDPVLRG